MEKSGIVFAIQNYAIYDGPGIRTCVFFKGCPLRCAWCHNPESQRPFREVAYLRQQCRGCGKCVKNCPSNALKPAKNGIRRDGAVCNGCGACAALCPAGAMEPIGSIMTSGAVAKRVLEDAPFFKESSGGVTVSGGEPTAQKDFLYETLWRIKENGIHTAIETCGLFSRETLRRLAPVTDLFLFDIKHVDGLRHEASTGVRPEMILSNFGRIVADYGCEKVIPRIPLIPGFNTDDDSIAMIAAFLHGAGYSGIVHILPYNCLSKQKYEKLGRTEQFIDRGTMEESRIESIRTSLQRQSFQVYCNN